MARRPRPLLSCRSRHFVDIAPARLHGRIGRRSEFVKLHKDPLSVCGASADSELNSIQSPVPLNVLLFKLCSLFLDAAVWEFCVVCHAAPSWYVFRASVTPPVSFPFLSGPRTMLATCLHRRNYIKWWIWLPLRWPRLDAQMHCCVEKPKCFGLAGLMRRCPDGSSRSVFLHHSSRIQESTSLSAAPLPLLDGMPQRHRPLLY